MQNNSKSTCNTPSWEGEAWLLTPEVRAVHRDLLLQKAVWRREEELHSAGAWQAARWPRLTSTVVIRGDGTHLWCDAMRMTLYLSGLPLQNPHPQSDREHHIKQIPLKDTTKYLNRSPQNCHSQEEPKEMEWLTVLDYPGWDPSTEERCQIKTKEIWIEYGL